MSPRMILVADDDEDVRIITRTILVDRGITVEEARNGGEAVRAARRQQPDLILMDLMMPATDGWSAMAQLKADPELSSIPVVAITSSEPPLDQIREAGFCASLRKPVTPLALVRAIDVCLEAHGSGEVWIQDLGQRIGSAG